MAEIKWAGPALEDLNAIAEYIALDKPEAAIVLVRKIVARVEILKTHPKMGPRVPELLPSHRYRQLVESPCRILYRYDSTEDVCHILQVIRGEKLFQRRLLLGRDKREL